MMWVAADGGEAAGGVGQEGVGGAGTGGAGEEGSHLGSGGERGAAEAAQALDSHDLEESGLLARMPCSRQGNHGRRSVWFSHP